MIYEVIVLKFFKDACLLGELSGGGGVLSKQNDILRCLFYSGLK